MKRLDKADRLLADAYTAIEDACGIIEENLHPGMRGRFLTWHHDANINIAKLRNLTRGSAYRKDAS